MKNTSQGIKWTQKRDSEKGWCVITFRMPDGGLMPNATYSGLDAINRIKSFCETFLQGWNAYKPEDKPQ